MFSSKSYCFALLSAVLSFPLPGWSLTCVGVDREQRTDVDRSGPAPSFSVQSSGSTNSPVTLEMTGLTVDSRAEPWSQWCAWGADLTLVDGATPQPMITAVEATLTGRQAIIDVRVGDGLGRVGTTRTVLEPPSGSAGVISPQAPVACTTVSGTITANGQPLEGVLVRGLPIGLWTGEDGAYSVCVDYGWSGVVRPDKLGFSFNPESRVISSVTQSVAGVDFQGTALQHTLAGTVRFQGSGLSGVSLDGLPGTPVTDDSGAFSATVPFHWTGTIAPVASGYSFLPDSRSYVENGMSRWDEDFTAIAGTLRISGRVTYGAVGLANVRMVGLPGDVFTDESGAYEAEVPAGWSGAVSPERSGYQIAGRTYTGHDTDLTDQDYEATELPPGSTRLWVVATASELVGAVNGAQSGDAVLVKPGTYGVGRLLPRGGVTLLSEAGAAQTKLVVSSPLQIAGANTSIDGFTIETSGRFAAVLAAGASGARVRNCVLRSLGDDYAVEVRESENVLIERNVIDVGNGGVLVRSGSSSGSLTLRGNTIMNITDGVTVGDNPDLQIFIENNRFESISGDAIELDDDHVAVHIDNNVFFAGGRALSVSGRAVFVDHNTFVENATVLRGYSGSESVVTNNILQDNVVGVESAGVAAIHHQMSWPSGSFAWGTGEFILDETTLWNLDPQLVDSAAGDAHLLAHSPARGRGEGGSDLGAYGGAKAASWADAPGTPESAPTPIALVLACPNNLLPNDAMSCKASAYYQGGFAEQANASAIWVSATPSVLASEGAGSFRALATGSALVTVEHAGLADSVTIVVGERPEQCGPHLDGETILASVATGGAIEDAAAWYLDMTPDGRYVAFSSPASNLVNGDTNGTNDIFVRDLQGGTTERVSLSSLGAQTYFADFPAISADGRYVAFSTSAPGVVPNDNNDSADVFVRDRVARTTQRVSVRSGGAQVSGYSEIPAIDAAGRYVAFESNAPDFGFADANNDVDVFLYDRVSGQTVLVSANASGATGNARSRMPRISADGRYVAFWSRASDLVAGDTNAESDVFVWDRVTGTTERVSVASNGFQGDGGSYAPDISADGRYVVFFSRATTLVPDDTNGQYDIFLHDRQTHTTELVSLGSQGVQGNFSVDAGWRPSVSDDGRFVAFASMASNLVSCDTNGKSDVFVRDRESGETYRMSESADGAEGDGGSVWPVLSGDGGLVAFRTAADNLTAGDSNGVEDIVVRVRGTPVAPSRTLLGSVRVQGAGSGVMRSDPPGLDCGATCSAAFPAGTVVTLIADPGPESLFAGWNGDEDCTDGGVTLDEATSCIASFAAGQADLSVTLSMSVASPAAASTGDGSGGLMPGSDVSYVATVSNDGTATAHGVWLTFHPDGKLTSRSASPQPAVGTDIWSLGDLAPGESKVVTIGMSVPSVASGTLYSSATVAATEPDPSADNTAALTTELAIADADGDGVPNGEDAYPDDPTRWAEGQADISLSALASPAPALAGASLTYRVNAFNIGPDRAIGVVVIPQVPGDVDLVSLVASHGTCAVTPSPACEIGGLAAGEEATVLVTLRPLQAGSAVLVASANAGQADPVASNNEIVSQVQVAAADPRIVPTVGSGQGFSFGLRADGTLWAWGDNASGALGDGSTQNRSTPDLVPGIGPVAAVDGGDTHTLALMADGTVWAWGGNGSGQLGDGTDLDRSTPERIFGSGTSAVGFEGVVAIGVGGEFSVALRSDGSVWTWGNSDHGQLGRSVTAATSTQGLTEPTGSVLPPEDLMPPIGGDPRYLPHPVEGLDETRSIAVGWAHVVALMTDGTLRAWGFNNYGGLGDGTRVDQPVPVAVPGLSSVVAVAAGHGHTVALKADGTVWTWGYNQSGQLGDGTTEDRSTPVQVPQLSEIAAIAAGYDYTLALKSDGTLWAWGANSNGQLGTGSEDGTNPTTTPTQVAEFTTVASMATAGHALAIGGDGHVWTWGPDSAGQLGDGGSTESRYPVPVLGQSGIGTLELGTIDLPRLPIVRTDAYSAFDAGQVRLNAAVGVGGAETEAFFEFGTYQDFYDPFGSSKIGSQTLAAGHGNQAVPMTVVVSDLACDTLYAYRAGATNASGTAYGDLRLISSEPCVEIHDQSISFGPAPSLTVGTSGHLEATGGESGNPVTFSSQTLAVCTVSGDTVMGISAGTCIVAANQAGNADYNAAPQVNQAVTVRRGSQTIVFGTAPSLNVGGTAIVSATGGASGNSVIFSSQTPTVCSLGGNVVAGLTAGTCIVAANQAGNGNYYAGTQVTVDITVGKGDQVIVFGTAPSLIVGGTGIVSATGGASGNPVTFASQTPTVCNLSDNAITGLAAGSCIVVANQAGNPSYNAAPEVTQDISVAKGSQTIVFGIALNLTVGRTGTISASGGLSGNPLIFTSLTSDVCTMREDTVTAIAVGTCSIAANQAGSDNYNDAPEATIDFEVNDFCWECLPSRGGWRAIVQ